MRVGYLWEIQKEKCLVRRPRRKWMDNVKMDPREIEWDDMNWIDLA
jgi:hypothetical protein